ncbi:MAG: ABC transporter permease subunit [Alphaproteobacteria bacterium]
MRQLPSRLHGAALRALSLVALVAIWEITAALADSRYLPGAVEVAVALWGYAVADDLIAQVGNTLIRVAFSFTIAMVAGIAIGLAMGRDRRVNALLDSALVIGLNIPALVVIILCFVWLGLNEVAVVAAVVINKIPIVVVTMREGARAIDRDLLQVARVFRLSPEKTFFKVYLPQLYPYVMASARTGLALIWKIVLVAELLGSSDGIGFKLGVFFQFFDIAGILAYSFGFIAVVLAIEFLILAPLDRKIAAWRP